MKKNLIFVAAILFAAKLASAQTDKGTQNLGLTFTVVHSNLNGTELYYPDNTLQPELSKYTYLTAGLNYGYFIANKLDIGASLTYGHSYNENLLNENGQGQTDNTYEAEITIRKYLMCSNKFGFRVGPYLGYERIDEAYTFTSYSPGDLANITTRSIEGGAKLDIVYYPLKKLGLSATLANAGYSHGIGNDSNNEKNTTNGYSLNLISDITDVSLFYIF